MTKKTIPSKVGGDKAKSQSPEIRSSISSSDSQKKPLTPASSRDIKSGGSQPARTAPEITPAQRRPVPSQGVPGTVRGLDVGVGGAVIGAAEAQASDYASRMAMLRSRWDSVAGKATLASLYSGMEAISAQLNSLVTGISDLRARGFRYGRGWEDQIATLQGTWVKQREDATRILESERQNLESARYEIQTLLNRAVHEQGLAVTADSRVSDFARRVDEAERRVSSVYQSTRQAAGTLSMQLREAETIIEALESASFQLFPEESGIHVCKAEWYARGAEPLEGLLFMTDSRLLFERRQEVVTKKVLFFKTEKKMEQELLWYAPIGGIEVAGMEDKKELLRARKELLILHLEGGDAPHEVTLNLTDARNEDWARLIKRAQEGQFDFERADAAAPVATAPLEAPSAEAPESAQPAAQTEPPAPAPLPTKCPSCGAALPTIYKGMREVRCAYCDTLIRLG